MSTTIQRLNKRADVKEAWSEGGKEEDGYWVTLAPGFADLSFDPWQPTHTIHEWTVARVLSRMKDVRPCDCEECKYLKARDAKKV